MKEALVKDIVATVELFIKSMQNVHVHQPNVISTIFNKVFDYKVNEVQTPKLPRPVNVTTTAPVTVIKGEKTNG